MSLSVLILFVATFVVLAGAATGLAIGAMRGRELRRGSCGGGACPDCEGCAFDPTMRRSASGSDA